MLIDLILDRKDGVQYDAREFYYQCMEYGEIFPITMEVTRAMDGGTEEDVKKILCSYVMGEYNPKICDYINSVEWL